MPPEVETWMRPYWGGKKIHLAVWSARLAAYRARCDSNMELDDRDRLAPQGTQCASCVKWAAVDAAKASAPRKGSK